MKVRIIENIYWIFKIRLKVSIKIKQERREYSKTKIIESWQVILETWTEK